MQLRSIVMSMYVCVCVCLSVREDIPGTTRAIFTKFLCMLPMAVARSSSSRVTKSQGEGAVLGVFIHIDNALCSIAFGTHTKTATPIEMPFVKMSELGTRNSVLRGVTIPEG